MGTRHLICAVVDGEYKLAQYGQWDGYPEGGGLQILNFLRKKIKNKGMDQFKEKIKNLSFVTEEELVQLEKLFEVDSDWNMKYPEFSRDTGAKILNLINNGTTKVINSLSFAGDSLFCEWCYVIDFDKNTFEIFRGSNKKPVKRGRFLSSDSSLEGFNDNPRKYHPVKLFKKYALNDLFIIYEL